VQPRKALLAKEGVRSSSHLLSEEQLALKSQLYADDPPPKVMERPVTLLARRNTVTDKLQGHQVSYNIIARKNKRIFV